MAAIADSLVGSVDGVEATIRKEWVGLILLPAVSSVAGICCVLERSAADSLLHIVECVTAVNVSVKDQLTLSISVAVGSTIVGSS